MEVFSILAPLMEGTEGLKKAEEALNLAKIGAMFDLMRGVLDLFLVMNWPQSFLVKVASN